MENIETIKEFLQKLGKKYPNWNKYSTNTLVFAYQMGLPPQECVGMYPESDWEEEWLDAYDRDYALIDEARYGMKGGSYDPR